MGPSHYALEILLNLILVYGYALPYRHTLQAGPTWEA